MAHYSPAQISAIAQSHGAPKWLADALGATSVPESGGDPHARSSAGASGLLQILPSAWPALASGGNLFDPDYNVQAALYVIGQQGSTAWSGSGTWRGPPVPAGRFHFPFPKPGVAGVNPAATGTANAGTGGGVDIAGMLAGPLLRALLYVAIVSAGVAVAGYGTWRVANASSSRTEAVAA